MPPPGPPGQRLRNALPLPSPSMYPCLFFLENRLSQCNATQSVEAWFDAGYTAAEWVPSDKRWQHRRDAACCGTAGTPPRREPLKAAAGSSSAVENRPDGQPCVSQHVQRFCSILRERWKPPCMHPSISNLRRQLLRQAPPLAAPAGRGQCMLLLLSCTQPRARRPIDEEPTMRLGAQSALCLHPRGWNPSNT